MKHWRPSRPQRDVLGFSLIEALIALVILGAVIVGIATVISRLVANNKHMEWRQQISELHNLLRRNTNCPTTMAAATCNGAAPVAVLGPNGSTFIGLPPNNRYGKFVVQVTCQNASLVVNASVPNVKDPLTGRFLNFNVVPATEQFCNLATASNQPNIILATSLFNIPGPFGPVATPVYGRDYAAMSTCPAGYQVIGNSANCEWAGNIVPACCGGSEIGDFPLIQGTISGWYARCAVVWENPGGDVIGTNDVLCYKMAPSGRLDN